MAISEFQIRAWQVNETQVQVIVHSSPLGDIRKPITVSCNLRRLNDTHDLFQEGKWFLDPHLEHQVVSMGRQLADVLLPRPVYALLTSSLQAIGPDGILRIRLCLDAALVDLPWEYLYRPDAGTDASLASFLLFDHRICLVRESAVTMGVSPTLQERQRMVFAGTLWSGGQDVWGVREEYRQLTEALASVEELLSIEFTTASGNNIALALIQPAAIFHYSGHTYTAKGHGYLVREAVGISSGRGSPDASSFEIMACEELADLLRHAETRLAVFSACNSGRWAFAEPLLRAGLPALIGTQGIVSVRGAYTFSEKLYASLAVGLSLDEALIGARFQLLKEGGFNGQESLEWGVFMAYMPATNAILLPRAREQSNITSFQEIARHASQQAITAVTQRIGPSPQTAMVVDQHTLREVIVEHFTLDEEEMLCADIKQDLANDGVELNLDLDAVGGPTQGEPAMVLSLITYLDRRGYLSYLVKAVRQARPGFL